MAGSSLQKLKSDFFLFLADVVQVFVFHVSASRTLSSGVLAAKK
jgi:hypothetical protein